MLYMDHTFDEEDTLMILQELEEQNSKCVTLVLAKLTFPKKIILNEQLTMSFPPLSYITDNLKSHANYDQANKLLLIFIL